MPVRILASLQLGHDVNYSLFDFDYICGLLIRSCVLLFCLSVVCLMCRDK